jgi:hypothetical protein
MIDVVLVSSENSVLVGGRVEGSIAMKMYQSPLRQKAISIIRND